MIPENSPKPLATAIPKHNGIATKKTTIAEEKSAPKLVKYFFIIKFNK
jgi:hypothetical protein